MAEKNHTGPKLPEVFDTLLDIERGRLHEAQAIIECLGKACPSDALQEGDVDVERICRTVASILNDVLCAIDSVALEQRAKEVTRPIEFAA